MNLFDGNTKSAIPASDVFAIIFGFIWKKPLITLMQAFHACAARRCRSFQSRPAVAAALELPKLFSKAKSNAKAAAKGEGAKATKP
ncbi:hypothetical protein J5991_03970 [Methanocorpusculum sp.]|nr:hypothetical protein [Methanocorpusculum sp.]